MYIHTWHWLPTRDKLSSQKSLAHTSYKSVLSGTTVYEVHICFWLLSKPSGWLELKQVGTVCGPQVSEKILRTVRSSWHQAEYHGKMGAIDRGVSYWKLLIDCPLKCVCMKTPGNSAWRTCWNDEWTESLNFSCIPRNVMMVLGILNLTSWRVL